MDGARDKKVSGSSTTYTFFAYYEEEVTGGITTAISDFSFGSLRIAVKCGNTLDHLHGDHLGSTSLTTRGSAETASRAYYAYGAQRSASGDVKTDHTPEPSHYGLRSGYLSALWSVEFNELVRFTHQPSPRPRADIILMSE